MLLNKALLVSLLFASSLATLAQVKTRSLHRRALPVRRVVADTRTLADSLPALMPYNRTIDAAGKALSFGDPKLENHALDVAAIPGTQLVVIEDRYGLAVLDRVTQTITYRWSLRDHAATRSMMSTFSGIEAVVFREKTYLIWGASEREKGKSGVVVATWAGGKIEAVDVIPFAPVAPSPLALPNDVAVQREGDEAFLYIALNGNNQLVKVRLSDRQTVWTVPVGVAPYGVALANGRAFVTNWAGPVPVVDSTNSASKAETAGVPWGQAYIDPKTGAMSRGTVSVIDQATGRAEAEIKVGLHPNAILSSTDGKTVYVANGNSDYISVIDPQTRQVTDSIFVGLFDSARQYVGSTPNALALDSAGTTLYVSNGLDNAVAVVSLTAPKTASRVQGYIPTQAYPAGLTLLDNKLFVCNIEGNGARALTPVEQGGQGRNPRISQNAYTAHRQLATVSVIPLPANAQLPIYTERVRQSSMQFRLALAARLPRPGVRPRPVPERIGEPSVFKHVVYIIKENRTYDQVLGDMPEGRGMPSLCVFGDSTTPNQHRLAREFVLLDNYYASGKSSAEGHHWVDAGMVTDYTEKSVRAWFRSYPHVLYDALVYNKNGLIWNNALDHGKSVRIYGEACTCQFDKKQYNWQKLYQLREAGQPFSYTNTTTISRVRPILAPNFPGCDDEIINDQMRADAFIRELNETAAKPGDTWPNLMVMSLPNDHTSGLSPAFPTPRAMVADNDLAVGRMVEAIQKSRFGANTVIFITEDDSQAGWDHISAYRTTGFVISPYSRLKRTVTTNYNQTSMLRTIEQILGLPPMNVIDATAQPMFDCFADQPDLASYTALPNRVPLNEMNKPLTALRGKARQYARESMEQAEEGIDTGEDAKTNQILWFWARGNKPYPKK
ncbi:bifunctional YncE family protein/alkaline phosphatase family protein [Fibrella sp. HMF5335]|uniref:Bifunctional YncE family protein/alkaline phosphatase family protein n=1 Tax=Fibrella rubiginis TaxID=2817060 RepID=A0A939GG96_9BACT|nr:YncE family protein [Fibrella rubiginis]MBO0936674.1 bifunctional YncE family protein/alkaline phosphatase family protein [Fibrella rubiginis]